MDGTAYQEYFLQPQDIWHRRYEALRAVFVDEQPMQDAAQRIGVSYGTLRNWVSDFRRQRDAGRRPPFSRRRSAVGQRSAPTTSRRSPSRMSMHCHWKKGGG